MRGDVSIMVDTSKIVPQGGNKLKPEVLEMLNLDAAKKGEEVLLVVVPGSGIDVGREYTNATPAGNVTTKKDVPWITVMHKDVVYRWNMSATANQLLGKELGFETDHWVGATLKPFVDVIAGKKTIKAIVFSRPKK